MFQPNTIAQCNVCKREYTSYHFEAMPGVKVYVCQACLESSKNNFIWVCLNCGKSYVRPKNLIMNRLDGYGIGFAARLYESKIIQGITMCMSCNPEGIIEFVRQKKCRAANPGCIDSCGK